MTMFREGWYLIYTKPRHEKKVHQFLLQKQISSLLPVRNSVKKWHDRKKLVEEPLFPSYIFLYVNTLDTYFQGLSADGAMHYVKSGSQPARIQETVISNLRILTQGQPQMEVTSSRFEPGEKLTITKGALMGLNCELIRYCGKEKILVRVELLNRSLLVSVTDDQLLSLPVY
ncbi:MAG: UpxY family transcription antiterminator [Bacteroidetes bacterium]|nr:UpxY family transcription antiterminator [Bacteroidota bacterium]